MATNGHLGHSGHYDHNGHFVFNDSQDTYCTVRTVRILGHARHHPAAGETIIVNNCEQP